MAAARMLGPAEYSIIATLLAIFLIIYIPAGAIQTIAMKYSASYSINNSESKIKFVLTYLIKWVLIFGLTATFIFLLFTKQITKFLQIEFMAPFLILLASFPLVFLLPISRGIMQGMKKFSSLSVNIVIDPSVKLVLGMLLIWFGYKSTGAMASIFFGLLMAFLFSFIPIKSILKRKTPKLKIHGISKYSVATIVTFILFALLVNIDIVLVKHFFSEDQAGIYAAIATIAKIIFFLSSPVVGVMFPSIAQAYELGQKHYKILINSFFFVFSISLIILIFYVISPSLVIKILYGQQYTSGYYLLGLFGFAILFYSLVNVFINYFLSIKKLIFILPLALVLFSEIVLIWFFHDTPLMIVKILTLTMLVLLAILSFIYLFEKKYKLFKLIKKNISDRKFSF
jgi:O-antigen/teichoic acid export membrane protein